MSSIFIPNTPPSAGTVGVDTLPLQHIDSFSRLRTAHPAYRFDSQLTYQIDPDLWDTLASGGSVAHEATERAAVLTATAAGANSAILQGHYHAPYTPGRGQLAFPTFVIGPPPGTGGFKRVGYFDGSNGIYLERLPTALNLVLKSTTSKGTETVEQVDWNIDPMDGSGPSGIALDLMKAQILSVQMQALYAGLVIVGFDIGGQLVPAHGFYCANEEAVPYIAQASLPIRYEVGATADTDTDVVMHAICASVISEGGAELHNIPGRQFVASGTLTDALPKAAVLAIQCQPQLNAIEQNALAIPTEVHVVIAAAGAWIEIRRNATITAGSFAAVDSGSVMEFSNPQSTTPLVVTADTGTLIDKFYVPAAGQSRSSDSSGLLGKALLAYSHLLSEADNLVVVIDGGNNTNAFVSVKWKEIR